MKQVVSTWYTYYGIHVGKEVHVIIISKLFIADNYPLSSAPTGCLYTVTSLFRGDGYKVV